MDTRDRRDVRSMRHVRLRPTAPIDPRVGSRAARRATVPEPVERRDGHPGGSARPRASGVSLECLEATFFRDRDDAPDLFLSLLFFRFRPRSKHKAVHKTTSNDDKRLDNTVKRLGVQQIPGIEEVNIFQEDSVIHYTNPTVKASIAANTYVVSGPSSTKKLQDLLPGIINQLGPDNLANLKKIAAQYGADGDDVPDVKSFENAD
jgi:nascent polypeptide-associated complex subunit beta